jgi:predicted metalloprotease with PDZ domain
VLPLAGLRLLRDTINEPRVGIGTVEDTAGVHVTQVVPMSSADVAGVQPGDLLLAVGGIGAGDPTWSDQFRAKYSRAPQGTQIPILLSREGKQMTLTARLLFLPHVEMRLEEDPRASAKARRIREGILRGLTTQ